MRLVFLLLTALVELQGPFLPGPATSGGATPVTGCAGYAKTATATVGSVTGTLSSFPLVIKASATALKSTGAGGSSQTSYDWCISDSGNTTVYSPVWTNVTGADEWDRTNGILIVELPGVSVATGTVFNVYVGKASATSAHTYTTVTDANFCGFYPLQENGSPYNDKSTCGLNSTGGTAPTQTTGILGKAQDFASSKYIKFTNGVTTGTTISVSALINPLAGSFSIPWEQRVDTNGRGGLLYWDFSATQLVGYLNNKTQLNSSSGVTAGTWHHEAATFDGTNWTLFGDGAQVATTSSGVFGPFEAGSMFIGGSCSSFPCTVPITFSAGLVQELRISNNTRTAAWIAAESSDLLTTASFVTVSAFV